VLAQARDVAVLVTRLGVTGGEALSITGERPATVAGLRDRFEAWLPAYMAG
jgi:phosphoribosylformylglycinamidine synthase